MECKVNGVVALVSLVMHRCLHYIDDDDDDDDDDDSTTRTITKITGEAATTMHRPAQVRIHALTSLLTQYFLCVPLRLCAFMAVYN